MPSLLRVMFVDDDVNVLHGMGRSMRDMRNDWDMQFLPGGVQALDALAIAPVDVIVSDMRMPGMDGCQLLTRVKELYPETVRLVLSGYAEPGAIMRLVGTAHQYISKPGESAVVKAAIAQTQLVRELLVNPGLIKLVGNIGSLPSMPSAFAELSQCVKQPNADLSDAARIIARDVAMTANIMKLVNSAFFGARRQVTSVERAIAYLGWDTLTALVLGHGLFKSGGSAAIEALWEHSLHTATAARAIALCERLPGPRVEEAFLTGMLHDVGRVVHATRDHERTDCDTSPDAHGATGAAYSGADSQQHAAVGAYLLGLWGFPSRIVAAIALHDTPSRRAESGLDLTVITHLADRLVNERGGHPLSSCTIIEAGLLEGLGMVDRLPHWREAVNSSTASSPSHADT